MSNKRKPNNQFYVFNICRFCWVSHHVSIGCDKVAVGEKLVIRVTSNITSLNGSKSHIACQHNRHPDCSSTFEPIYYSTKDRVNNGTTGRSDRFVINKRSMLDFDMIINGVTKDDQGCYFCKEMSEEDSDEKSTRVLINSESYQIIWCVFLH